MARKSTIEWTEASWNPITGCTKCSLGCLHCYAERMAHRLQAMGNKRYKNGFNVTIHRDIFELPLSWKKSRMIFVNSMSDLFHEDVPDSTILELIHVMKTAHWHTFQVLTKRAERLVELSKKIEWPQNIWIGVTIESYRYLERLELLKEISSSIRFVSFEPLIERIGYIDLEGIDWIIVGGESGPEARFMDPLWVKDLRDQAILSQTAFFFKQWGGTKKKKNGRILDGTTWDEMPERIERISI